MGRGGIRISQHHYSGHFCAGGDFPLASFMNKNAIRKNLTMFQKDIAATQSHGLDYILGYVLPCSRHLFHFPAGGMLTFPASTVEKRTASPATVRPE